MSQPIQERVDELISGIRTECAIKLFGEDLDVLYDKGEVDFAGLVVQAGNAAAAGRLLEAQRLEQRLGKSFVSAVGVGASGLATLAAFSRVVNQASAFYLLGYAMTPQMDGRFHELKVRVKRPGLDVRSRTGYWAPHAADVEHAKSASAAAELTPPLAAV